jgi:hypothetical protein
LQLIVARHDEFRNLFRAMQEKQGDFGTAQTPQSRMGRGVLAACLSLFQSQPARQTSRILAPSGFRSDAG